MKKYLLKTALSGHSLFCLAAILALVIVSSTAQAQGTGEIASPNAPATDETADAIIVTGSHISRPTDVSAIPITVVSATEIGNTGKVSVGDVLNDLPSLRTTFSQTQNTGQLGTTGLNLLDLRGLGSQRTLVLVNGRRHVGADILSNAVSVDINTIPSTLIERVDIVTGGNSAVYGSDAIAGAVNFVLKGNFEGIEARARAGVSGHGDAGNRQFSITAGKNFADGRGNIAFSAEYGKQNPFFASQREAGRKPTLLVQVDSDPAGTPNGSDGTADRQFLDDVHSATLALGGLTNFATRQCGTGANGAFFDCTFLFQSDGTLIAQTGTRAGFGPNGSFIGGNGSTNREGKLLGLLSQNERYGFNLIGHYDFSPAAAAFLEAKYYHSNTLSVGSGPAFIQGTTLSVFGGDVRERPRLDNPYLSSQAKALITQQLTMVANLTGGALPTDASRFNLRINLLDLGLRQERAERDTFRILAGLRGEISGHLKYEVSANYGKFSEATAVLGNVNTQRLLLAMDAARNTNNQIVCRSQIDPAVARALVGNAAAATRLAGDVSACVPINLFGSGNVTEAARKYVVQDTVSTASIDQFDAVGFLSGDTGGFFNLPGGPIGLAIGAEYRRETNKFNEDPLLLDGMTFYNSIATFRSKPFIAKEIFGELRLPVLAGLPLVHELTLSAAGRISGYGGATGTTYAYNLNGDYSPVAGLRFRGGYARALRAPNLQELYSAQGQNFAGNFGDPCSARNLGSGTSARAANCAADGRPSAYDYAYTASLGFKSGGNPNLTPEYSSSWTAGAVFSPAAVRGLSISADYYDITVNNVILSLTGQTIVNQCYDSPTLTNSFCSQFQRNRTGGTLASGEEPFRIIEGSLLASGVNFARLKARGIDFDVHYRRKFGRVDFDTHFVYTRVLKNEQFINPANPAFGENSLDEVGDPKDAFNWNFGFGLGRWKFDYQLRFIGKQAIATNAIENLTTYQGRPPQDADYAADNFYPSVFYHNIKLGADINDHFNVYAGIDNLFDKDVPFNQTGSGTTANGAATRIFDNRGRFFYAGIVANF